MNRNKLTLFLIIFLLNCERVQKLFGESMEKKITGVWECGEWYHDKEKKRRIMFEDLREAIDYKNPNKNHFFDYYMELDWKNRKGRMKLIIEDKIYDLKLKEGQGDTFIIEYPTGKQRTVYFRDKYDYRIFFDYSIPKNQEFHGREQYEIINRKMTQRNKGKKEYKTLEDAQYYWEIQMLMGKKEKTDEDAKKIEEFEEEYGF